MHVWDLSGTAKHCELYVPGHRVHWIHFNHSMRKPSKVIPATATVDDHDLVHIHIDGGEPLVRWNHQAELVRKALERFDGRAEWKPRWYLLVVPAESSVGSAGSVFNMARPDQRRGCMNVEPPPIS